jgi:hypothetical protein
MASLLLLASRVSGEDNRWARGPLVDLPAGWECGAVPAIHYWQGDCWDTESGAVVRFGVSDIDWGGEICSAEPGKESTEGFVHGARFCAEEFLDARSWWLDKFHRELPEVNLSEDDSVIPLAGISELNIYFVSHGLVWGFHSQFCTPAQRGRALDLVVGRPRVDFGPLPDLIKHAFGSGA